jgi:Protein of unknown function (DUF1349)
MAALCNNCGSTLAADADFCSRCGAPTSSYYSRSASSQVDPTFVPHNPDSIISPKPPANYGALPYGTSDKNPYGTVPPPSPPPIRPRLLISIICVLVVFVLILGGVTTFVLVNARSGSISSTPSSVRPTEVTVQNCGGAFSDGFNGNLHVGWSWVDPTAHATYSVATPGLLTISTVDDKSSLDPTLNTNAPRLLQRILGDFTVQTLVTLSADKQVGFQAADILIWQDERNFIRVERYFNSIDFEQVVNGVFSHNAPASLASSTITGSQFELQVQRKGALFTASWRVPGQGWQAINTANIQLQTTEVGLDLISQGAPKTTANYDYFNVLCP